MPPPPDPTSAFDAVLLARHGETEWNVAGRRQGLLDSPLTAAGREHARRLATLVAPGSVDAVVSSPLGRALSTAQVVASALGHRVTVVDELAELDHGRMSGLTNAQIEERSPGELARRQADLYRWEHPGGESYATAEVRVRAGLARIAATGSRRPLLVAHEMVGRLVQRLVLGLDVDAALARRLPHGEVLVLVPGASTPAPG